MPQRNLQLSSYDSQYIDRQITIDLPSYFLKLIVLPLYQPRSSVLSWTPDIHRTSIFRPRGKLEPLTVFDCLLGQNFGLPRKPNNPILFVMCTQNGEIRQWDCLSCHRRALESCWHLIKCSVHLDPRGRITTAPWWISIHPLVFTTAESMFEPVTKNLRGLGECEWPGSNVW